VGGIHCHVLQRQSCSNIARAEVRPDDWKDDLSYRMQSLRCFLVLFRRLFRRLKSLPTHICLPRHHLCVVKQPVKDGGRSWCGPCTNGSVISPNTSLPFGSIIETQYDQDVSCEIMLLLPSILVTLVPRAHLRSGAASFTQSRHCVVSENKSTSSSRCLLKLRHAK